MLPKEATAGEWVTLKASRTSGPWVRVKPSDVPDGTVAFPKCPPPFEDEVQANLQWLTDPPDVALFDVPTMESVRSDPLGRKVVFSQPGVYKVWAVTAYPTRATSNVETITIRGKQ
jgi:hypothetical protein